ncbi:acetyltransferase-like isoleucine patch superfamily enzyme [Rhodococcus sp. SORGH_AS303]|jgi:maltose O-acetyltransferase|nr:acetyltransferase-like isoleucine patch superfamily enzyme [Rhodococcus sp. SORGH_AS_0301]MDQ1203305.1 acetyltransferase-like isoleucine patch superfamily enzyme [Rhodococcus sp. SORGH_AS_0303]
MAFPLTVLPLFRGLAKFHQSAYMKLVVRLMDRAGVEHDGRPLWISPSVRFDMFGPGAIRLGNRCVLSENVVLLTHDFSLDRVSERRGMLPENQELFSASPIVIGEQAFVGLGTVVLPGVTIGAGAIVGAGSVVTCDVEPDTVVAGNPARRMASTDDLWERRRGRFDIRERRG